MNVKPSARLRWFDLPLGALFGFGWTSCVVIGLPIFTPTQTVFSMQT